MAEQVALVVDDDPNVREVLSGFLRHLGHQVLEAEDAAEALALLNDDVRVVFCDIHMPGQSGLEILERMHEKAPVVMITADTSSDAAIESLRGGAVDFLRKPFRAKDVKSALERADSRSFQIPERAAKAALFSELLAGVAHELRSPLTWVNINLDLLEQLADGNPEMEQLVDELKEGSRHMKAIINGVRDATRESYSERYDVGDAVGAAVQLARTSLSCDVKLHANIQPGRHASGVRGRITQAATNLIINAGHAIEGAGHIEVQVRGSDDGEWVEVTVDDSGPGVPAELRERVFEQAFTTRAEDGGSGLGLWLSRRFVEEQGGRLTLAEGGTLGGARFLLQVPAARG